jgi:hypothetical protein
MAGAGLIGWIGGEIWVTDPAVAEWTHELLETHGHWLETAFAAAGALLVIVLGKAIAARKAAKRKLAHPVDLAAEKQK